MSDQLEQDLRRELARQVAEPPALPALADVVVRRGRRVRRTRAALAAAAVVAVVGAASVLSLGLPDRTSPPYAGPSLEGPPRVPLVVQQEVAAVLDWPAGQLRERRVGEPPTAVAVTAAGVLLVAPDGPGTHRLLLLPPDAETPEVLLRGLVSPGVAVTPDGARVAVVVGARDPYRELREVELATGRVVRVVVLGPPTLSPRDRVDPVAWSGGALLLQAGEGGDSARALLWEPGDEAVVGRLAGYDGVLDGAAGRGAFGVAFEDRCRTEVAELRTGGRTWRLCREPFVGFSPDGTWVLATDAVGNGLVVRAARDGALRREFPVPLGLRASAWESEDTLLYTTVERERGVDVRTVVVRCSVEGGRCATAASFPYVDRIPQPVPPAQQ